MHCLEQAELLLGRNTRVIRLHGAATPVRGAAKAVHGLVALQVLRREGKLARLHHPAFGGSFVRNELLHLGSLSRSIATPSSVLLSEAFLVGLDLLLAAVLALASSLVSHGPLGLAECIFAFFDTASAARAQADCRFHAFL